EAGAGAGAAADHDGRTLSAHRDSSADRAGRRSEVAERFADQWEKSWRDFDGDACGARADTFCDCGDWVERESGEVSGGAGGERHVTSRCERAYAVEAGIAGAVAAGIRARLQ